MWYLRFGSAKWDVRRAGEEPPCYKAKSEPSFADMIAAARRELWAGRFLQHALLRRAAGKIRERLPAWLLAS